MASKTQKVEPLLGTVTVTVPKAFNLRLDTGEIVQIKEGIQEMDRVLAEHWYSVANGVQIYRRG